MSAHTLFFLPTWDHLDDSFLRVENPFLAVENGKIFVHCAFIELQLAHITYSHAYFLSLVSIQREKSWLTSFCLSVECNNSEKFALE